jgi:uncharacterized protein (DUF2267 family)
MPTTETHLDAIDKTVQKTYGWLKDIEEELGTENPHFAYQSLRAVLQVLRGRLPVQEASDLASQLPLLISGIFHENWRPGAVPLKERDLAEFLGRIQAYFPKEKDLDPQFIVRAVFRVLKKHVSQGEIEDIRQNLPKDLKRLFD